MREDVAGRMRTALSPLAELKELADGDPDYELFVVRLKQLEALLRSRAQLVIARTPQEHLEAQAALDKARDVVAGAM